MASSSTHHVLGTIVRSSIKLPQPFRRFKSQSVARQHIPRSFHSSARFAVVKPYLLADIGEGEWREYMHTLSPGIHDVPNATKYLRLILANPCIQRLQRQSRLELLSNGVGSSSLNSEQMCQVHEE
jgi:hypothetical protein